MDRSGAGEVAGELGAAAGRAAPSPVKKVKANMRKRESIAMVVVVEMRPHLSCKERWWKEVG
jgi:hypothetical protein